MNQPSASGSSGGLSESTSSSQSSIPDLPRDPGDRYYLTHCYACQAVAKPDHEFIRNYGGVVCFSCRAFWRRAHQKSRTPNLHCKRGGGCSMSIKSRRKCQKCRYDLCKATGMTQEAILTEEQKKIRFRKMLQKRMSQNQSENSTTHTESGFSMSHTESSEAGSEPDFDLPGDPIDHRDDPMTDGSVQGSDLFAPDVFSPELSALVEIAVKEEPLFDEAQVEQKCEPGTVGVVSSRCCQDFAPKTWTVLARKIECIRATYGMTIGRIQPMVSHQINDILDSCDLEMQMCVQLKRNILSCTQRLRNSFEEFAKQQRRFTCLHPSDKSLLFNRNSALFIQLNIVWSLLDINKSENLFLENEIALNEVVPQDVVLNHLRIQALVKMFRRDTDINQFCEIIAQLRNVKSIDNDDYRSILAYIILFEYDSTMCLTHAEDLEDILVMSELMYNRLIGRFMFNLALKDLISILTKLTVFSSHAINLEDFQHEAFAVDPPHCNLVMPYTEEEENWLTYQFSLMDTAYKSVPLGEKILQEFVLYSLGVPFSKEYFKSTLSVVKERMVKVLKIHSEFIDSSSPLQQDVLMKNIPHGLAMTMVRMEHTSGSEQIRNGLGISDEETWKKEFLPVLKDPENIKKVSIKANPNMTSEQTNKYNHIMSNTSDLVCDPTLFKLVVLLVLTSNNDEISSMERIHYKYITILRRRIEWMHSNGWFKYARTPTQVVNRMFSSISNVYEISKLLPVIMGTGQSNTQGPI